MSPTILRALKLPSNLPFAVKEIIDIADQLPTYQGGWLKMPTRRKDGALRTGPRPFGDITHISLHHTATEGGSATGHANYHIGKKDAGIAYHIYIKGDQIYQVNDLMALTWHTGSNNHHTIGIAVEGNFTKRALTEAERNALYAATLTVMGAFNIPVENVRGHSEYVATACPGYDMNRVREDLRLIESRMAVSSTWSEQVSEINRFKRQLDYLGGLVNKGENDGKAKWAMKGFQDIIDYTKQIKYL